MFTPKIGGRCPIWRAYFSDGLVQPPTRIGFDVFFCGREHVSFCMFSILGHLSSINQSSRSSSCPLFMILHAEFIQHSSCIFHSTCIVHVSNHAFVMHHSSCIFHSSSTIHSSYIVQHCSFIIHQAFACIICHSFSCIYSLLTWEWMVGRLLSSWGPAYFQVKAVSFREGIHRSSFIIHMKARCFQPNNSTSPKPDSLTVSHHGSMGQLYIYESLIWVMTHLELHSLLLNIMARRISGCHVCCRNFGCARFDN